LATADVDNDGFTDLLVGTPYEDVGSQTDSGIAQIIWGASGGLGKGKASSELTQSSFGRTVTAGDQLGYAVDTVNELGADSPMVAVGVPGGNVSGQNDAGWAGFLSAGLSDPRAIDQNSKSAGIGRGWGSVRRSHHARPARRDIQPGGRCRRNPVRGRRVDQQRWRDQHH
jgi:hypothetical protein